MVLREFLKDNHRNEVVVTLNKLTKRKDSSVDVPSHTRETTKKKSLKRGIEVPEANFIVLKAVGFPFRLKGDPKSTGLEVDNEKIFSDYAREQWMGSSVRPGTYLFDRYIMPDYAFEIVEAHPEQSVITQNTQIQLLSISDSETVSPQRLITLEDVIGHEPMKRKCRLILEYLRHPAQFGEWAPRAILFHGPPGTGKTLTARAVASEADARIFLTRASDLIGVHVGDGGRRITALFDDARKHAPSIIFIDELDAIGLARSFQSIRGDVSEVVTALLGELDQTTEESGVVVIGATNALPLIDPAIQNRFDTVFEFSLPTPKERLEILKLYTKRLPLKLEADLQDIVDKTEGLSGRDLRDRILKESLHLAISESSSSISKDIVRRVLNTIKTKNTPDYTV